MYVKVSGIPSHPSKPALLKATHRALSLSNLPQALTNACQLFLAWTSETLPEFLVLEWITPFVRLYLEHAADYRKTNCKRSNLRLDLLFFRGSLAVCLPNHWISLPTLPYANKGKWYLVIIITSRDANYCVNDYCLFSKYISFPFIPFTTLD